MDLENRIKWSQREDKSQSLLNYYEEHYSGITRWKLQKIDYTLYRLLRRGGLLEHVPLAKIGRPLKHGDDPLGYYEEHYSGVTRGVLQKKDSTLYEKLRKKGLLEHVPLGGSKYGDDTLGYYEKHYPGMTRGTLQKRDHALYERLRRAGLLKHVPLAGRRGRLPKAKKS